jgi:predicted lipid-binding transport protein (Tim44 family)
MRRRSFTQIIFLAAATGAAHLLGFRLRAASAAPLTATAGGMMGGMMGGDSMGETMGPMRTGMELFMRHTQIRRSVTELPNGVHAVTESDDPQTAALIQAHVGEMYQRLDEERAFSYPMSRSVPAMFAHSTLYQRQLEATPKGVAVTETAEDPALIATIREHARELNGFVREGMPAMMRGMMR